MYASKKHDEFLQKVKNKLVRPDACALANMCQGIISAPFVLCYSIQHVRMWPVLSEAALTAQGSTS